MFEPFAINEIKINNNNYMKKTKNLKNNVYEINPIIRNTIDNYYDNFNINKDYLIKDIGDKTNKTKKNIILPREEKMQFIPLEVKKRNNIHSVEKFKKIKYLNNNINNTWNRKNKVSKDNNIYANGHINLNNQRKYLLEGNIPYNNKIYNNVLNKFKISKKSSSMDKQYINDGYNNEYRRNKFNKKMNYFINEEN